MAIKISKFYKIIGNTYGQLTVTNIIKNDKAKGYIALCDCTCGKKDKKILPYSVVNNITTSCGCSKKRYIKTTGKNNKTFTGYEEISGRTWSIIKRRAFSRNRSIDITVKYAWSLFLKQKRKCALSGVELVFAISNKKASLTSASLDRIDSNKGYVKGNVQWVHKDVNIMKNIFDQDYFIKICKLITLNNGEEN